MPFYLEFYDTSVRGFLRSCGAEEDIIFFGIESFRHIKKICQAKNKPGEMIGRETITDKAALELIFRAKLVLIPLQQDSIYGGHISLVVLQGKKAYNYCSSAGDCTKAWNVLLGIFAEATRNQEQLDIIESWSFVKILLKVDTQSKAVCLEFACGLVTMYVAQRLLYSALIENLSEKELLNAAKIHYMNWFQEYRKTEKAGQKKKPKTKLKEFLAGCGLGSLDFQRSVKSYPDITKEIGEWASSSVEKVEKCVEYGGKRFYYVKHVAYSREYNTDMPESDVPQEKIDEFQASKKLKR